MTDTVTTDLTPEPADGTGAPEPTPPPLRLKLADLRELGVCPEYLRTFGRLFPPSEYPDGAPLDEATCREHADDFDWTWAADRLLTSHGYKVLEDAVRSRATAHEDLGSGRAQRRAAALGRLLHTRPEYRSRVLLDVTVNRQQRADDRLLRDLDRAQRDVTEAENKKAEWARLLGERRAALPVLEREAAAALRRRAERAAAEHAENVRRAEADLAAARDRATEADAELARLLVQEDATTATTEPTTEPTTVTEEVP